MLGTYVISERIAHGSIRLCDCLPMDVEGCICWVAPTESESLFWLCGCPGWRAHTAGVEQPCFRKLRRDSGSGRSSRAQAFRRGKLGWLGGRALLGGGRDGGEESDQDATNGGESEIAVRRSGRAGLIAAGCLGRLGRLRARPAMAGQLQLLKGGMVSRCTVHGGICF